MLTSQRISKTNKIKNQRLGCVLAGIAIWGLTGCSPESIILEGKVSNLSGNTIVYRPTMDGIYNATQRDTLFLQADSTYRITLPSKGNEKISFYIYGQKYLGTVYAEPGKNVLDIDASLENNLSIENTLVKENVKCNREPIKKKETQNIQEIWDTM